jgi:hypothetical protein
MRVRPRLRKAAATRSGRWARLPPIRPHPSARFRPNTSRRHTRCRPPEPRPRPPSWVRHLCGDVAHRARARGPSRGRRPRRGNLPLGEGFGFPGRTVAGGLGRAGSVPPVLFSAPELEAPSGRIEVLRQLSLECCELVAKLEHAVVEEVPCVTHVRVPVRPLDGRTTFGARHVPGLRERDPHRPIRSDAPSWRRIPLKAEGSRWLPSDLP